ncbi:PAS domain S-box protein [Candidatus Leptofilum sp.]|uniref:PAS domain S-box protein n=1 Tax=Candidatus Leptofilum sp. TaxID=3241576 RepID=UPI003B5CF21A
MRMKTTESPSKTMRPWSRFSRFRTIRARMLVAFVLLVLLPVVLITARTAVVSWRDGQTQVTRQLESVATLKEAEIERWLDSLQLNLTAVLANSESDLVVQMLAVDSPEQTAVQLVQENWTQLIKYTGLFEELFLMDQQGRVVLSNGATAVGTIHSNQTYFQQGLEGSFVHPPFYSPTLLRMSVVVTEPVLDGQGKILGVLAGRASMTTLNEIMLERSGLGETGETYLVGANHVLLTNALSVEADIQAADSVIFVRSEGANQALDAKQNAAGLYANYDQAPVIGVYRWLPRLKVALLAEQSQAEAFASLEASLLLDIGLGIAALAAAVIVAFYVTRGLTQPLQNLTATAQKIAHGDFTLTADIEREDEIGILASAFNKMTGHLNQLITDLEQRVNELKMAQLSLRDSEDRYRTLYNSAPVMMHSVDVAGNLINVNLHWLQTMGYEYDEVIGRPVANFFTETSKQYATEEAVPKFFETGYVQDIPYQFVLKNGDVIDVLLTATAYYDNQNEHKYSISVIQDVTERKRAEEELRLSEARQRALLDAMPDMMFRISLDGVILDFKAEEQAQLAMPAAEIIGTNMTEMPMPPEVVQEMLDVMRQTVATGKVVAYEYDLQVPIGLQTFETRMVKSGSDEVISFVRNITERKRAEEALRRSEALLNATNQIARTGGWELDLQTNELYWTDTIKEIHEVPLDYVPILEEGIEFYAPEHVPVIRDAVERAIDGEAYDVELQIITAKQKRLWVRAIGIPVYQNGEVIKLRGVFQDIHERKLADEALRQSEANLLEAQQIAKLGNFEFNLHTQQVYWSDEVYRIFGLPLKEEVTLERYQSLLAPEDFERVMTAVGEAVASLEPYTIEHDIILSNGQRKHLQAIGRPLIDATGEVSRIFGTVQDISEAKKAEQTLHENVVRYRALFDNANDAIWVYDLEKTVVIANASACELTGYSLDELIGKKYDFFTVPEEVDDAHQKFRAATRGRITPHYIRTVLAKNGEKRICEVRIKRVEDDAGTPLFIQGVVRDVTERKQAEAQIQASLQEKEVLLKEIHHRVKNNLQVISSLLDLQSAYIEDDDVQEMFQESRSRVRSMALVHEQLYQSIDLAQIDFADYVHSLTSYLSRVYGQMARGVTLDVEVDNTPLSVETAVPLGLIINELVSNAFKHAFPNNQGGFVRVQLTAMDDQQLYLTIQDSGIGLPAHLDFHNSPSLGLTIVMTLINQLKATIRHVPQEEGTRFEIDIWLGEKDTQ